MTDMHKQQKHSINPVAAAVGGAIVGAGVAVAATTILQDEKAKGKIKQVMKNAQEKVTDMLEASRSTTNHQIDEVADKAKHNINKLAYEAKEKMQE